MQNYFLKPRLKIKPAQVLYMFALANVSQNCRIWFLADSQIKYLNGYEAWKRLIFVLQPFKMSYFLYKLPICLEQTAGCRMSYRKEILVVGNGRGVTFKRFGLRRFLFFTGHSNLKNGLLYRDGTGC